MPPAPPAVQRMGIAGIDQQPFAYVKVGSEKATRRALRRDDRACGDHVHAAVIKFGDQLGKLGEAPFVMRDARRATMRRATSGGSPITLLSA